MKRIFLPVLLCGLAWAQSVAPKLAFEVASIRPGPSGSLMQLMQGGKIYENIDDARVNIGGISLDALIQMAFPVHADQIVEPSWTNDLRFDIQAKLPQGGTKDQVPEMLQSLLVERFKLVAHHDQKVQSVYALTVGKDGPKFHESPADDSDTVPCNGGFRKVCHKVTMEYLARALSLPSNAPEALDRPVVDMTGLKGSYDFELVSGRVGAGRGARGNPAADAEVVSVFDAVKALGLKLEPVKHTYDILVIDHVERVPTEN